MTTTSRQLSEKEAQIYDRQIRLWGVDAQQRISKTRILIYGISGLAAEICKNIVLAGVGTVHIMDDQSVDFPVLSTNFLVGEESLQKNRAVSSLKNLQELNPLVKVSAEEGNLAEKDDSFWKQFDIVFLTNTSLDEQVRVNDICRKMGILFFTADTFGLLGLMFQDLLTFDYDIKNVQTKETKSFRKEYVSLRESLSTDLRSVNRLSKVWLGIELLKEYINDKKSKPTPNDNERLLQYKNEIFLKKYKLTSQSLPDDYIPILCLHASAELSAVCAQIGGIAAQEIIKVISRDAEPIDNYFTYDGIENFIGFVEKIYPQKK